MKRLSSSKKFSLFPKTSLIYFALFVLAIITLLLLLEYVVLRPLKENNVLGSSQAWENENNLINENSYIKMGFSLVPMSTAEKPNVFTSSTVHLSSVDTIKTVQFSSWANSFTQIYFNNKYINDLIWRSKIYKVKPQKIASKRILVVGDSFVWGDGYANMNDIWWRKLQRELVKRGYYDVQVIGMGWIGQNTREEFCNLKRMIKAYKPDIIVWGFNDNDLDEHTTQMVFPENLQNINSIKGLDKVFILTFYLKSYFPNLGQRLMDIRQNCLVQIGNKTENLKIAYSMYEFIDSFSRGENFKKYKVTVNDVGTFVNENKNIPIFFVTLPTVYSPDFFIPLYKKVFPLFVSNNIKIYNLFPILGQKFDLFLSTQQSYINPANLHPGPILTDFFAHEVANILEHDYKNSLPKKYSGKIPFEPLINDYVPMTFALKQKKNTLSFKYPSDTSHCLSMPYGYKYVQFNLSYPKPIKKITIKGKGLLNARLDVSYDTPKDATVYQLGERQGSNLSWTNINFKKPLNTIRVSANFKASNNRNIILAVFP